MNGSTALLGSWKRLARRTAGAALATAALAIAPAAASAAAPSYYPSGPQTFVPRTTVTDSGSGWTQCWHGTYADTPNLATTLAGCSGDYMMLASGPIGGSDFDVLAAAPRADVVYNTGTSNTPHDANGTGWYFSSAWSWGFAKQGDAINRNSCDIAGSAWDGYAAGDPDERLCWHTSYDGNIDTGWRSGRNIGLNYNSSWERFIYVSNGVAADTAAPTINCGSADGDWHANNVSIPCTASDDGSGLADSNDASFNLTTSVADGSEDSNASTDSRSVCDQAGNCATAGPVNGNEVDRKAPSITLTSPADGDTYQLGSSHAADYSCADGGSLVATCLGTVANGANVDTSSVGPHTFTVDSSDNVGNNSPQSAVNYSVVYDYSGFFSPVNNNGVLNVTKAGSAIPVKFSLGGDQGLDVMASGYPASGQIACVAGADTDAIEQTVTAGGSSLSYDSATDTYTYVWKSAKSWAGTCRQLTVKLSDGTTHKASFQFK